MQDTLQCAARLRASALLRLWIVAVLVSTSPHSAKRAQSPLTICNHQTESRLEFKLLNQAPHHMDSRGKHGMAMPTARLADLQEEGHERV